MLTEPFILREKVFFPKCKQVFRLINFETVEFLAQCFAFRVISSSKNHEISLKVLSLIKIQFSEEECYHCMASLVAAKDKVFITQTKLLHEVTWKTVMQIAKKYAKNAVVYLQRLCDNQKSERIFIDWCWWILGALPFPHLGECQISKCNHLNLKLPSL
jgi:hypothetical protein